MISVQRRITVEKTNIRQTRQIYYVEDGAGRNQKCLSFDLFLTPAHHFHFHVVRIREFGAAPLELKWTAGQLFRSVIGEFGDQLSLPLNNRLGIERHVSGT